MARPPAEPKIPTQAGAPLPWVAEVWKTGTDGKAVRIAVKYPTEPTADDLAYQSNQTTGLFRRLYQEWPSGEGKRVKELT